MPFNWFNRKHGPRETQRGTGCYVGQHYIVSTEGPNAKPPPEPSPPRVDHATKIINVVEELSTPWSLSRRELVRRDEILEKLKNHVPLTDGDREDLARLIVKKGVGES